MPLLIFLSLWKLRSVQKKQELFQARGADYKWATQLYDLIKNCGKKQTCWLESVFGSHNNAPNVAQFTNWSRRSRMAASMWWLRRAVRPTRLRLSSLSTERRWMASPICKTFSRHLGFTDKTGASPKRENGKRLTAAASSLIEANASGGQHGLLDEFKGQISLQFPKCAIAECDFEQRMPQTSCSLHIARHQVVWHGNGIWWTLASRCSPQARWP